VLLTCTIQVAEKKTDQGKRHGKNGMREFDKREIVPDSGHKLQK
jgi:hypothetical protein